MFGNLVGDDGGEPDLAVFGADRNDRLALFQIARCIDDAIDNRDGRKTAAQAFGRPDEFRLPGFPGAVAMVNLPVPTSHTKPNNFSVR